MDKSAICLVEPKIFNDERGRFVKYDFPFESAESFYSENKENVFRGMHYQKDTAKFVYVSKGAVIDVWLNLKTGEWGQVLLSDKGIYIPEGFAHGFHSLTDSTIHYMQSKPYSKEDEGGIASDSFGFQPFSKTILSERDKSHPTYENFRRNSGL